MYINELKRSKWIWRKSKRLWRWNSSWKWNYSTKWLKWQKARSWGSIPSWFEWGQTPLNRRLPKLKWFKRNWKLVKDLVIINLETLEQDSRIKEWELITQDLLMSLKYLKNKKQIIKVLWRWEISKKLKFDWNIKFSDSARKALWL